MRIYLLLISLLPLDVLPAGDSWLFDDANVISMADERVLTGHDVLVRDGTIVEVAAQIALPEGVQRIAAAGLFLMPGLAEMHAHIPPTTQPREMTETLTLYLVNGLTTVRGMLGEPGHLKLREQQRDGKLDAPRIIASSPSLNGRSVRSPAQAVELVQAHHRAGYDFLKIHPGITLENYRALAAEARRLDMPFAGHVPADVTIWRAVGAGQATIDHMDGYVEALTPQGRLRELAPSFFNYLAAPFAAKEKAALLTAALNDRQVWTVPTQSLIVNYSGLRSLAQLEARAEMQYVSPQTRRQWAERLSAFLADPSFDPEAAREFVAVRQFLLRRLQTNGPGILLGSDAPQTFQVPGFSAHDELQLYVEAGLTPYQALRTATVNVASYLGFAHRRGQVAPGFDADLVLLGANPLSDIANTRHIQGVMLEGRWYSARWIERQLAEIASRHQ